LHNEKLIGTFYEFDTTATYVTLLSELKSYNFCNLRLHMCYPLKSVSSVHNVIEPFCKVEGNINKTELTLVLTL